MGSARAHRRVAQGPAGPGACRHAAPDQRRPRPTGSAKALTALGRLTKTIHILRYIQEEPLRQAIQLQLNRGEFRHTLAKWLFFANQGEFRTGDYEEIMNKASCLSLLSNAVLVWNTVHIDRIVAQLRATGNIVLDEDLARVSPLLSKPHHARAAAISIRPGTEPRRSSRSLREAKCRCSKSTHDIAGNTLPCIFSTGPSSPNAIFAATGKRIRQLPIGQQLAT